VSALIELVAKVLARAKASSDVVLAVVMASIIGAMIVPLPEWMLDAGIAINLAAAAALLVAALYAKDALKVASFPTLLLITTLFRLAMNVSSTRLALSEGHAGEIIQAFGEFVVRGDYVVGAVIFAILTLVQFLVVAKGAERVAEVSARFTLDAMPGKQMSIDADLRAGAITQDQARARRRDLERESQLFGSMDGAMKFVKGDVIAGLVITLINLVGGTIIGSVQNGMSFSEAAGTYALISIGDGLVSQIPSLCIAVAAGLVVTRVASESADASLGLDIGSQFFGQWKALAVVAGLCLALAAMPGMPHLTFIVIASLLGLVALGLRHREGTKTATGTAGATAPASTAKGASAPAGGAAPRTEPALGVAPLQLDLAVDLTFLTTDDEARFVSKDLDSVRDRIFAELGVRVPPFRIRTGAPLPSGGFTLAVDEVPAGRGKLPDGKWFALAAPADLAMFGVTGQQAVDPLGRPLVALSAEEKAKLESMNVPLRTSGELVCDVLVGLIRKRAAHFLGVQEVQGSLSTMEATSPALVKEALQKVPLPLMTDVFKRLLAEQVSIRNLRALLEALVSPTTEGDATQLAEKCRQALGRQISWHFAPNGPLLAYLVDPAVEETLRQAGPTSAIDPAEAGAIIEGVRRIARQGKAVLLASPDVRRLLRRLVEGVFPDVAVLTFGELDPELQVRPVGRLLAVARG
jgi:type III secretion protein V